MRAQILGFAASVAAAMSPLAAPSAPLERFVQAAGPAGPLKGTLLAPSTGASAPVVLLIPGSGPVDRDGDAGPALKAASLRLLAEGLAADGVASVRIDKRGMYASAAAGDPEDVTLDDYARDAHAWIAAVRQETGARCVWIAGHSEGGAVALAASAHADDICGLVLIATPGRATGEVMREQLHALPGFAPLVSQADQVIDALEQGRPADVSAMAPPVQALFRPARQRLLISEFAAHPLDRLRAYPGPVLVVQGTTDLQVGDADARALAAARPGVKLLLVPGMNHVLKIAPAERQANVAAYADPSLPLAPGVADAIAAFVKAR